jgi:hypothetical protein
MGLNAIQRVFYLGVSDGARTRDFQDHNLVLYQLNYTHHRREPLAKRAGRIVGDVDTNRSGARQPNRFLQTRPRGRRVLPR